MAIMTYGCSQQGGREYNEDCFGIGKQQDRCCVVVADGLGGHGGGHIASRTAVETILRAHERTEVASEAWMLTAYMEANRAVLAKQQDGCRMKTTCVSLFIEGENARWAHLGDSRLYHFKDGRIAFCTADHSVSQMAVLAGEITRDQIRFHEDRNRVLRALGADETIRPDFGDAVLDDGAEHVFLLCTDGFWEYVLEEEMVRDLARSDTPEEWIALMMGRLRQKASGDNDNYTAAAVFL